MEPLPPPQLPGEGARRPGPATLEELCAVVSTPEPWCVNLILRHIGGGKATLRDLESIESQPDATALSVSGLDQKMFETLVSRYGSRFDAISFWKCPRIADLTPLEDLPQLRLVVFFWNQLTTRLWDFRRTPNLAGLYFEDFRRLRGLGDLEAATSLEALRFGDAIWTRSVFESLAPLEPLVSLRRLFFSVRRIEDARIQPLASLRQLEQLWFPTNLFTTPQLAWLRARLPESVVSNVLGPLIRLGEHAVGEGDERRDVLVVGKRKPFLNSDADGPRIRGYVVEFERLVQTFRDNPGAQPD